MEYTCPLFRDKQWLIDFYCNTSIEISDLCKIANCSTATLHTWINKFELPKRQPNISIGLKNWGIKNPHVSKKLLKEINISELLNEYLENHRSIKWLCNHFDSDYSTIKRRLDMLEVEIRDPSYYIRGIKRSDEFRRNMSIRQKGIPNPRMLGDLNPSKKPEVRMKISKALRGVPKPQTSGPLNGNWHGGISFEKYSINFNENLREDVRNAFDRKCFICGITKEENGREIIVHHIDYDKQNNNINNLVPLCCKHHGKTNFDRAHWSDEFRLLLFAHLINTVLCLG